MPTCAHNGCQNEYTEEENTDSACKYHPGKPVFHEGLKSWSCCSDVNKPELDFDEFMKIQGCQTGKHSPKAPPKVRTVPTTTTQQTEATPSVPADNKPATVEVFGADAKKETIKVSAAPKPSTPAPIIEEEDDLTVPVPAGSKCRRTACNGVFVSEEESRSGDGESAVCVYHPAAPIFHEGSKGYLCCKRRVLEFDEFLKIEGCKKGRHVFVPKNPAQEQIITTCRIDHYQTPNNVCVSVFAKKADKEKSQVTFEETQVHLDLHLPDSKRFQRSLNLYGSITPDESTFSILGTKVELNLKKRDGKSWNLLEATDKDIGSYNLIFGVSGRTGTIGAQEAVIDNTNRLNP